MRKVCGKNESPQKPILSRVGFFHPAHKYIRLWAAARNSLLISSLTFISCMRIMSVWLIRVESVQDAANVDRSTDTKKVLANNA